MMDHRTIHHPKATSRLQIIRTELLLPLMEVARSAAGRGGGFGIWNGIVVAIERNDEAREEEVCEKESRTMCVW